MSVKVFDLNPSASHPAYRPLDGTRVHGWEEGVDLRPQIGRVGWGELAGMSLFSRRERGQEKLFLMLMMRGRAQPVLADSTQVELSSFPLPRVPSEVEGMRLLGRLLCHRGQGLAVDQGTLDFVKGRPPRHFDPEVLALTTAFGQLLVPEPAAAPATSSPLGAFAPGLGESRPAAPASQPPGAAASRTNASRPPAIEDEPALTLAPIDDEPAGHGDSYSDNGNLHAYPAGGDGTSSANPYANPYAQPGGRASVSREPLSLPELLSSLAYPFRGSALVALILFTISPISIPLFAFGGLLLLLPWALFLAAVTAAVIFEIIRQTARGADVMEGSPDLGEIGPRFVELLATWVLGIIPLVLSSVVTYLLSSLGSVVGWIVVTPIILLVDLVCFSLWMIALGATAVYDDWSFAIRIDLHLRALVKCVKPLLVFALKVFVVLVVLGLALVTVLRPVAALAAVFAGPYLLLASAHFIGLFFRENEAELEAVYLYR